MNSEKYRPDIDGLRAIAVLSVLFFHLDWSFFQGGYVGVDVFFVISGFLITRLIKDEADRTGSFDFMNFYTRRVRRLFPAFFFTVSFSLVLAFFVFSPQHFQRFGSEALFAAMALSNVYFWKESGYFNPNAEIKPLLHTWSLSVEEQFYLIWPLILVFALTKMPKNGAFIMAMTGAMCSLFVAVYFQSFKDAAFFLPVTRAYEFAIGALMVWLLQVPVKSAVVREVLALTGLGMIGASVILIEPGSAFPSYQALMPCLGAAILIYCAHQTCMVKAVLTQRSIVFIGLISYSLYLIHWPLIVFYKYSSMNDLSLAASVSIIALSMLMAVLMYHKIERPFRRRSDTDKTRDNDRFVRGTALLMAGMVICVVAVRGGVIDNKIIFTAEQIKLEAGADSKRRDSVVSGECRYHLNEDGGNSAADYAAFRAKFTTCHEKYGRAVIVLGDSHSRDLYNALAVNSERAHIVGLSVGGCRVHSPDPQCHYEFSRDFIMGEKDNIKAVLYKQQGEYFITNRIELPIKINYISDVTDYLHVLADVVPVIWVGPHAEPNINVDIAFRAGEAAIRRMDQYENKFIDEIDQAIAAQADESGVAYLSTIQTVQFDLVNDIIIDGELTYDDPSHWNDVGERIFGQRLLENGMLRDILSTP